jgi:hypothetical protein
MHVPFTSTNIGRQRSLYCSANLATATASASVASGQTRRNDRFEPNSQMSTSHGRRLLVTGEKVRMGNAANLMNLSQLKKLANLPNGRNALDGL